MKIKILTAIVIIALGLFAAKQHDHAANQGSSQQAWWMVQSVDTMKYSRDVAAAKINDPSFDATIDTQVKNIADTGATHVAIGTPYDEQFIPFLKRWVAAARKYNLNVWFRGNFSGWEQWFDYSKITRDEHITKTRTFIIAHPDLFIDGDIFSPCPECENGGPGDPRITGDTEGFRLFLIAEHDAADAAFVSIHKNVNTNFNAMNGDVAKLIMDKRTTKALGGTIAIDHYVNTPERLIDDIRALIKQSGGNVMLSEFGAPIPDIHGDMTETQQADWIDKALQKLAVEPSVVGINYWVNTGGSTQLWDEEGKPKKAVRTIISYFQPKTVNGTIMDFFNKPINNAKVTSLYQKTKSNKDGYFNLPVIASDKSVHIRADGYVDSDLLININQQNNKIIMKKIQKNILQIILDYIKSLFNKSS